MELRTYFAQRVLQSLVTIFVALTIDFYLFRILPGDPVSMIARDPRLNAQQMEILRASFGLDKPLYVQYLIFLANTLKLNLGLSFFYRVPVSGILFERLTNTIYLVGLGTLFSMVIGLVLGIIAGWYRGKAPDSIAFGTALFFYSMPSFWISMVLIYALAVTVPIFPTGGMVNDRLVNPTWITTTTDSLYHLALPLITYSLVFAGAYALIMRSSVINILSEDYVVTARAKGLTGFDILRKHVLKNAALPSVTLIAMNIGLVVLGAISVETVFNWPGVGLLVYQAIFFRDYPLLQGTFIFFTVFMVLANLIADMLYSFLDPRVRY
ncbi:MAG TPA: ABC transporter permease [archaeon]|nr:ABC transporter permease [archaeon]